MNSFSNIAGTIVAILFVFGLGFGAGYKTYELRDSKNPITQTDTVSVSDTVVVRDTVYLDSPIKTIIADSIKHNQVSMANAVSAGDQSPESPIINVSGSLNEKDLKLDWFGSVAVLGGAPRLFDVVYKYKTICPVITDSVFVTKTQVVTNSIQVKRPVNYLSIGLGANTANEVKLNINYHKSWYYVGPEFGYLALANGSKQMFVGLNAGININL
jgi:hypothetical protein